MAALQSTTRDYIPRLDHLRFLAAFIVLAWHGLHFGKAVATSYVPTFWVLSLFEEGHTGVALFLSLSGFVLHTTCRERGIDYFRFLRNRLLRIAPLFVFWTLLSFYTGSMSSIDLVVAVFTLLSRDAVVGSGWTVLVEFQLYLVFPFLLASVRRNGLRYLVGLLVLMIAIRAGIWVKHGSVQSLAYSTVFGRLDQFVLGMIASEIYHRKKRLFAHGAVLAASAVLWVVVYHAFNAAGGFFAGKEYSTLWIAMPSVEGFFYALLIAAYLGVDVTIPKTIDRSLSWLGSLSYSFYLGHLLVIEVLYRTFEAIGAAPTGFALAFAFVILVVLPAVIALSALTYYLVEKPFLAMRLSHFMDDFALPQDARIPRLAIVRDLDEESMRRHIV